MRVQLFLLYGIAVCVCSSTVGGQPASSQGAVTAVDLRGAVVETTVVHQQVIQRTGAPYANKQKNDTTITIGMDDRIGGWAIATGNNQFGVFKGQRLALSSALHRPFASSNVGGGNGLWIFQGGRLVHFYVYKGGGALKREISFSHTGSGLACKAAESFARENGTGPIIWNSSVDGVRTKLVSSKQISSTCRVTKSRP
jgi:hypothetical protein